MKERARWLLTLLLLLPALNLRLWRKKPICQLLLEQSLFNGIGNYLRCVTFF
jgi:hypothetical protein